MQREIDIIFLELFVHRLNMYIPSVTKDNIISFIHGYESGKKQNDLTQTISELLESKYNIEKKACGWPHQIQTYSKRKRLSWVDGFKLIINEIIELKD
ncbi:hypothetical protein [Flammeovirga sp. EKP202]|uniref:hypothetical protein n=1 Tax=Flammeovirga sp. EKP202 TaxID=2770592 RepID=UPI00165FE882|nr:hypothetical protein [Flammeovirga sp. EKP202]MBD0403498.1 hypothetical protein [Flammeovirga sp. EKP202]